MSRFFSICGALAASSLLSVQSAQQSPCLVTQLTADDAQRENQFGRAVAIQRDEIFVGSPMENGAAKDSGSVHVLRRDGLNWFLQVKLTPPDAKQHTGFGTQLAVDGNTLVVASGRYLPAVYVYERLNGSWTFAQKLASPPGDAGFGEAVAVRDGWLFVGAPREVTGGLYGTVHVYRRSDAGWDPAGLITPSHLQPYDAFGTALAAGDGRLVVGSPRDDLGSGAVYVFERAGFDWIETARLTGHGSGWLFGICLALRDGTILAGAIGEAFVYEESGGGWIETAHLVSPSPEGVYSENFGRSVALTDELVLVGADRLHDGNLYAFRKDGAEWNAAPRLQPAAVRNGSYDDRFAWSIAADGKIAVVTAENSAQRATGAGAVYVYSLDGSLCATLSSPRELSWGRQRLEIDRGPEHAGHFYRVFGSMSGTSRGIRFRGTRIPLNLDSYFMALLRTPELCPFASSTGLLDANGRATLILDVPPDAYHLVVGLTLDHAFIERGSHGFEHVSNAVTTRFRPRR